MQKIYDKYLAFTQKNFFIIGLVLFVIGMIFCMIQEINTDDETWFLQVVNRVLLKKSLYKEIFLGTTPLSVYIAAFFCIPFGAELIILRFLLAVYFTLGSLLSFAILKELKVLHRFSLLLLLSFFVFSHFQSTWGFSGYNNLSKVFFLSCFYCTLKWHHAHTSKKDPYLILSSIFSALCFCTKQNIGLIAFIILFCSLFFTKKTSFKNFCLIFCPFLLITLICLSPIFFEGAQKSFVDYAFLNKTRYMTRDHPSYFLIPSKWDFYSLFIFLAPFLLAASLILRYPTLKKNPDKIIVFLFCIGSVLTLYPRPDNPQKIIYVALALITLAYLLQTYQYTPLIKNLKTVLTALFTLALFSSFSPFFQKKRAFCTLPHFHYILMKKSETNHWASLKKEFLKQHQGEPVFFLSTHSALYSLLFELPNPTPFDIPYHPALGLHGEELILSGIETRKIEKLYIDHEKWSNWSELNEKKPLKLDKKRAHDMREIFFSKSELLSSQFQVFTKCNRSQPQSVQTETPHHKLEKMDSIF